MKKKLIIFDLDNTFYEYQSSHASALKTVYKNQKFLTVLIHSY